jgi:uncharacterized protein (DUF2141 family)
VALILTATGFASAFAADQSGVACDIAGVSPFAPRLVIKVTGVQPVIGNVTFTLYGDQPAKFLAHHGKIGLIRVPLTSSVAEGCFAVSTPGTYAVALYHDANNNHHFDLTMVGLPAEGYGFSNNARIFLAPPSFSSVAFTVQPGTNRIAITLRY